MKRTRLAAALIGTVLAALALPVPAQQYPAKPVRIVIPFATGGGSDITARVVGQKLSEHFGQQFIPENRPGAGGLVGLGVVVKSPPDGYTIMISTSSWTTAAAMYQPTWDPINSVAPLIEVGYNPLVLSVHPALPVKTTRELIALARAKPGQLAYAMPGIGSITHMSTAYFLSAAKVNMLSVPYKSTGAVMTELLAGQTQMIMGGLLPLQPFIQAGRLRPIAVTTAKRWPTLPEVPAIAETLPGFEVDSWYGAIAPKGTPPAIVERLNGAMNRILLDPEMKKNLDQQGVSVSGGTAAHFEQRVRADYERWVKVVREAGLKPE